MTLTQTALYRFLPLAEAVRVTGWTAERLQKGVEAGTIVASMADDGTLVIAVTPDDRPLQVAPQQDNGDDINARLSQIRREDFAHLEGVPITVSEAARKYGVPVSTIHFWVQKGFISVLDWETGRGGSRKRLNEADMAYCAAIYKVREEEGVKGVPLLDEEGRPYLLRAPEIAQARRRSK